MSIEQNLRSMEQSREKYWRRFPSTSPFKLRWRALTVRHSFHVRPGESILELGAGSGLWTEHLSCVLRGENPITAAIFNAEFVNSAREIPNTRFVKIENLAADFPAESFDYIVGNSILCHNEFSQNLAAIHRLLKAGGQMMFFEANYWNPQVFIKNHVKPIGRWAGEAPCQIGMRRYRLMKAASHQGFTNLEIIPYDIIHARTPRALIPFLQSAAFVAEHTPLLKEMCGTLYIWAKKPGDEKAHRPRVNLATRPELRQAVSIVAPCYNEEMNVGPLVDALLGMYDDYIHEIVIVNDNSKDRTSEIAHELARKEPRIKVVDRTPPGGVGRALRDGYAAATGRYILTMDSDFVQIVPELRDLFDAVADGHDGAIGSRFSHQSVLLNYPFLKILCNRAFHLLVNLFLPCRIRDISNNLKLYRADILKNTKIEQDHFAANVETGLKPILAGYNVREVPISWINRTVEMGTSSFKIVKIAPNYFAEFCSIVWNTWRGRRTFGTGDAAARERKEPKSCPVCASALVTLYRDDSAEGALTASDLGSSRQRISHGRILRCRECGFAFRTYRPSADELASLYRDLDPAMYERESDGRLRTAKRHLEIVKTCASHGRLLDVGCASGAFLACAADDGFEIMGIEPSSVLCAKAQERLRGRGRFYCSTLQDADIKDGSMNVVTLWDVLEHVPDPLDFLRRSASLVKPGGWVVANVPDLETWQARWLGERWPLLLAEHLSYFSRKSLALAGDEADLQVVRFGRRASSFSLKYVLHRLAQHNFPGAGIGHSLVDRVGLGSFTIPAFLGESYVVWQRRESARRAA